MSWRIRLARWLAPEVFAAREHAIATLFRALVWGPRDAASKFWRSQIGQALEGK